MKVSWKNRCENALEHCLEMMSWKIISEISFDNFAWTTLYLNGTLADSFWKTLLVHSLWEPYPETLWENSLGNMSGKTRGELSSNYFLKHLFENSHGQLFREMLLGSSLGEPFWKLS